MMTGKMISIHLNGQTQEINQGSSLLDLINSLKLQDNFAFSINNEVIPKSQIAKTLISEGDWIELIQAVAGG